LTRQAEFESCELDDRFHEVAQGTGDLFVDSSFAVDQTRSGIMAGWRQAVELAMTDQEIASLTTIARSRSKAARRVKRRATKPRSTAIRMSCGRHGCWHAIHRSEQRAVVFN
jgi:hypothetical protein